MSKGADDDDSVSGWLEKKSSSKGPKQQITCSFQDRIRLIYSPQPLFEEVNALHAKKGCTDTRTQCSSVAQRVITKTSREVVRHYLFRTTLKMSDPYSVYNHPYPHSQQPQNPPSQGGPPPSYCSPSVPGGTEADYPNQPPQIPQNYQTHTTSIPAPYGSYCTYIILQIETES
jgi:hypothetical protein